MPANPCSGGYAWTRMGSLRSSDDPSCASAPLQDPGRTNVPSPISVTLMLPPLDGRRRLRQCDFGANTQLWHPLPYASRVALPHTCKARLRLAGWPWSRGNRTHWIASRGFSSYSQSSSSPALLTQPSCERRLGGVERSICKPGPRATAAVDAKTTDVVNGCLERRAGRCEGDRAGSANSRRRIPCHASDGIIADVNASCVQLSIDDRGT